MLRDRKEFRIFCERGVNSRRLMIKKQTHFRPDSGSPGTVRKVQTGIAEIEIKDLNQVVKTCSHRHRGNIKRAEAGTELTALIRDVDYQGQVARHFLSSSGIPCKPSTRSTSARTRLAAQSRSASAPATATATATATALFCRRESQRCFPDSKLNKQTFCRKILSKPATLALKLRGPLLVGHAAALRARYAPVATIKDVLSALS